MKQTPQKSVQEEALQRLYERVCDNDMLLQAIKLKEYDAALAILNKDGFQVDPLRLDQGENILTLMVKQNWVEGLARIFNQPDEILEAMLCHEAKQGQGFFSNYNTAVSRAIEMGNTDFLRSVKDRGLKYALHYYRFKEKMEADKLTTELINALPWDNMVEGYDKTLANITFLQDSQSTVLNYFTYKGQWGLALDLMDNAQSLDHEMHQYGYKKAKAARRRDRQADTLAERLLELTEKHDPKIAKRHRKGGLFGLGKH